MMPPEFAPLFKSLKVPLLTAAQVAAIKHLEQQWHHHTRRLEEIKPARIASDQKAAYSAFIEDPSPQNEQALAALTTKRHHLLSRAHTELRNRASQQSALALIT